MSDKRKKENGLIGRIAVGCAGFFLLAGGVFANEFTWTLDVPGDLDATTYLSNQTALRSGGTYSLRFDGPNAGLGPDVDIDALLLRDDGSMLFSTDAPFEVGGVTYRAADVVAYDAPDYSLHIDADDLGLGPAADIDALALASDGAVLISFDGPETIAGEFYAPSDMARVDGSNLSLFFDSQAAGIALADNLIGFDRVGASSYYLLFDAPVQLGGTDYEPGDIIVYDGVTFASFFSDSAFPNGAAANGFSLPGAPGDVAGLLLSRTIPNTLSLSWDPTCSAEGNDYAIYQGDMGNYDIHASIDCSTGGQTSADIAEPAGNLYFLIVAQNGTFEGSYGLDSAGQQRPPGLGACQTSQKIAPCP